MRTFGLLTCFATALSQEVDETAYLLQTRTQQQKSADVEDCYVTGGCSTTATTTTTEAPTTTRARPTRPATTTPRPTRPTTTTTEAPKPPPIGMVVQQAPDAPEEEASSYDDFCTTGTVLSLTKPVINNLGGMGPGTGDNVIKYNHVTTVDGKPVNLIISTDDAYYQANKDKTAYSKTGKEFISQYNGGGPRGRSDVMAIGSLATGAFTLTFDFSDDDGNAVVVPHLPMTFFDLDGSTRVGGKSYEEIETHDALAILTVDGTKVTHGCVGDKCKSEGAKVEIDIPANFKHLTSATKKAAITFFFKSTSSFDITYTLNWEHRVFLFNGMCINED